MCSALCIKFVDHRGVLRLRVMFTCSLSGCCMNEGSISIRELQAACRLHRRPHRWIVWDRVRLSLAL
jgi:hypothetical protein